MSGWSIQWLVSLRTESRDKSYTRTSVSREIKFVLWANDYNFRIAAWLFIDIAFIIIRPACNATGIVTFRDILLRNWRYEKLGVYNTDHSSLIIPPARNRYFQNIAGPAKNTRTHIHTYTHNGVFALNAPRKKKTQSCDNGGLLHNNLFANFSLVRHDAECVLFYISCALRWYMKCHIIGTAWWTRENFFTFPGEIIISDKRTHSHCDVFF